MRVESREIVFWLVAKKNEEEFLIFEEGGVNMCKKLIVLCLALVVGLSMPALASYIGFDENGDSNPCKNALKVDIDGAGTPTPKCEWQGWTVGFTWSAPISQQFANPYATEAWEYPQAQLVTYRKNSDPTGATGMSRNRSGGWAGVGTTGEYSPTTKGYGTNYIKLTLTQLAPLTNYRFYLWSYEARNIWAADPNNPDSKYAVWSTLNPKAWLDTHGYSGFNGEPNGYGPINQPQPPSPGTAITDTNMPCAMQDLVFAAGGRASIMAPVSDNNDFLGGTDYRSIVCCAMTDSRGSVTVYGWFDGTDWTGSAHLPLNGFMVVPEPATIALLGLGGLALIRRRKHA